MDEKKKEYDKYDQRRFADVLMEAEEIKKDPKKMAAAKKHIEKTKKQIRTIEDLKGLANAPETKEDD